MCRSEGISSHIIYFKAAIQQSNANNVRVTMSCTIFSSFEHKSSLKSFRKCKYLTFITFFNTHITKWNELLLFFLLLLILNHQLAPIWNQHQALTCRLKLFQLVLLIAVLFFLLLCGKQVMMRQTARNMWKLRGNTAQWVGNLQHLQM